MTGGVHAGVLNGATIAQRGLISPCVQRRVQRGMSYGVSAAGYDIRLAGDVCLPSRGFSLASSVEYFTIPADCMGMVCDKSTHARRGLSVFNTVIEPGWKGYLTLELVNHSETVMHLLAGDPIAQVIFFALNAPTDAPYNGKYQDQPNRPMGAIYEETQ